MKSGNKGRAVGYVRVSDESQIEGHSLDAQRREIARWCEREGYELIEIYADEGISAHTDRLDKRPALMQLLVDAEHHLFDLVVTHMLDRWSRNVGVQRQTLQRLGAAGVGFASVVERIDFTTPSGKLKLTMLGGVAEFFSDQLGLHFSKAFRQRAELGLPVGPVPFGYMVPTPGRVPEPKPEEAVAVRAAFEQRAQRASYETIADSLNDQGLRSHNCNRFTAHALKDLLRNRF